MQKEKPENIIRVDHSRENPYLQVCRKTIRDPALDLQAKGLLVFLLDKPNDWRVRPEAIAKELKVGRDTIYRILNRLIAAGYIYREYVRRRVDGKFQTGSFIIVFEDKDQKREWADQQQFKRVPKSTRGRDTGAIAFKDIPF